MDVTLLSDLIVKQGLGVASFAALMFFGWKLAAAADKLLNNHLVHFDEKLDKLVDNSTAANAKLDEQTEQLDKLIDGANKK